MSIGTIKKEISKERAEQIKRLQRIIKQSRIINNNNMDTTVLIRYKNNDKNKYTTNLKISAIIYRLSTIKTIDYFIFRLNDYVCYVSFVVKGKTKMLYVRYFFNKEYPFYSAFVPLKFVSEYSSYMIDDVILNGGFVTFKYDGSVYQHYKELYNVDLKKYE